MKRLVAAFASVFLLALFAKVGGALKEIAVADRLGTSSVVDLYVLAFTVATWPAAVYLTILTIALTPMLVAAGSEPKHQTEALVSQLSSITLGLGFVVGVVFYLCFPVLLSRAYSFNQPGQAQILESLLVPLSLCAALAIPVALSTVLLVSKGRHVSSLLEGVPSLVLAAALVLLPVPSENVLGIGTAAGFGLQLVLLLSLQHVAFGGLRVSLPASNLHWAGLRRGLSYTVYGYSVLALAPIIEQVLAGRLGSGGIASLGYASRVTALATGLVVTAINRVSLPHFSGLSGSAASVYSGLGPIASGSLLLGVAMMLGLSFLAQPLVALIFERGNFLPDDTVVVANLLRWNLTQLGPYFLSVVLSAWLAAQSRFREIFIACMVGFVMRVSFAWLGASHFGLNAVAAAATVGYVAMCAYLCWATLMRGATSGRLRTGSKNSE